MDADPEQARDEKREHAAVAAGGVPLRTEMS